MSIPKEPRQLMINLMYLVLTAMLALNVSAEIFNAFKIVNDGLVKSNSVLDTSNGALPEKIKTEAKKKAAYAKYAEQSDQVRALSKETTDYIQQMFDFLVDDSGDKNGIAKDEGDYKLDGGKLKYKGIKDKDVTTRNLLDAGQGEELKAKLLEARAKFIEFFDEADRTAEAANITINVDDQTWQDAKKTSWSEHNFKQMPLGAVEPMFTKWINDVKNAEASVLSYYMGKVGGESVVLDKFAVVSSPKKTYVIKGEKFETEVFLSASASGESNTGISISVNGQNQSMKDGVAKWSTTANQTGIQKYSAKITVKDPVTGESKSYDKEFEYEVGLRSAAVQLDKMNVFYVGVPNPITVSAAGVSSSDLKVNASGVTLVPAGKSKYTVTPSTPGSASITLSGGGLQPTKFDYKVKRIPDPVMKLANKQRGGSIGNGTFKAMPGLIAELENFDFDAKCKVMGFEVTRVAKRQDPVIGKNGGNRFSGKVSNMIKAAKPGDIYSFDNIKAKCPGDKAGRDLGSMSFKIK